MKLVFMGTPEFALTALEALVGAGHEIAAVATQPDRPRDRGQKITVCPVGIYARERGIPVLQPQRIREAEAELREIRPEAIVVAAYGQLIPASILDMPPHGCVNIHASLLPKYRGASPIARAIMDGEAETGVSIMRMTPGLDDGPVLMRGVEPIRPDDTEATLSERLAKLGGRVIVEALRSITECGLRAVKQDDALATFAPKMTKETGRIDWTWTAERVERHVRACIPWPSAFASHRGTVIKLWKARVADASGEPGAVLEADPKRGITVACGRGAVELIEVQREGKKRMDAASFLLGYPIKTGDAFDANIAEEK